SPGSRAHWPRRRSPRARRAGTPRSPWISSLLLVRRDRFHAAQGIEAGAWRGERRVSGRRCVEDVEADLVLGYVNGVVEADEPAPLRQLRRGRACPSLARDPLVGAAAGEVGLDEVARHPSDARAPATRRKRQNVGTL